MVSGLHGISEMLSSSLSENSQMDFEIGIGIGIVEKLREGLDFCNGEFGGIGFQI